MNSSVAAMEHRVTAPDNRRDDSGRLWVLVCFKPRMGADLGPIARMHLLEQGYDVLWPHYSTLVPGRRGRPPRRVLRSRYPGMLYCGADEKQGFRPIDYTPGVARIIRFGTDVAYVPASVIDAERTRCLNAEGLTEPPSWIGARGEAVYDRGDAIRSPHNAWAKYVAIVEADDGEVVKAWRMVAGKRLWFSYHHHEVERA